MNTNLLRKNILYLTAAGAFSVILVKTIIRSQRDAKFIPLAKDQGAEGGDYYSNVANVKPGFPLPADAASSDRKSEFEGSGLSYRSRKSGDKLGFWDRRSKDN